jgi:hypothetical protein
MGLGEEDCYPDFQGGTSRVLDASCSPQSQPVKLSLLLLTWIYRPRQWPYSPPNPSPDERDFLQRYHQPHSQLDNISRALRYPTTKEYCGVEQSAVKYVVSNADGSLVALMSKHSTCRKHFFLSLCPDVSVSLAIAIANRNFSQHSLIRETIRIKSGAWDDARVLIYSALNHIKYCLPQG